MIGCKKIFVFGTGRCGTVSLARAFSDSGFLSFHEGISIDSGADMFGDMKELNKFIYYSSKGSSKYYDQSILLNSPTLDEIKRTFHSRDVFLSSVSSDIVYCDTNPYGYSHINYIYKKYPDAFFIHLVRSPREVGASYLSRNHTYPAIPEAQYSGYSSGKPRPLAGDKHFHLWEKMTREERVCWFWSYVNSDIEKRLERVPDANKIVLRIEDLTTDYYSEILMRFGIKNDSNIIIKILNKNKRKGSIIQGDILEKYCSSNMLKYGYTQP